jgi:hypothetical protein
VFKGVMVERAFNDLPKHLSNFGQTAISIGRDLLDRFWAMKAEVDRRVAEQRGKKEDTSTTERTTATSNLPNKNLQQRISLLSFQQKQQLNVQHPRLQQLVCISFFMINELNIFYFVT